MMYLDSPTDFIKLIFWTHKNDLQKILRPESTFWSKTDPNIDQNKYLYLDFCISAGCHLFIENTFAANITHHIAYKMGIWSPATHFLPVMVAFWVH